MNRRKFLSALAAVPVVGPVAAMAAQAVATKTAPAFHWIAHPQRHSVPSIGDMKASMLLLLAGNPSPYCIVVPKSWHDALSLHAEMSLRSLGSAPREGSCLRFSSLGIPVVYDETCESPRAI